MNPTHNNPVTAPAVASALAPPQPHRPSTSCDRHPEERFTGFCPSCLFDRLSVLDITTVASSSSKKPPSSSAAALKSIFKPSSSSSSSFPELRRTKSFSAGRKNEAFLSLGSFEPQRRSCDVRARNTLWSLFNEDAEHSNIKEGALTVKEGALTVKEGTLRVNREIGGLETRKSPVFEDINCGNLKEQRSVIDEIIEEEEEEEETEKVKVKEQMEMNPQTTTTKKPTRSFWSAASVLSKKLQKWRQKQKLKKHRSGFGATALPVEKSVVRQLRDTQSEVAEYGYGRRSCDTDPRFSIDAGRFSLDAGRVSVDDPRYSFDEPRASFDGFMIGRTAAAAAPPRLPSMLAVVEDSPVRNQVPVEEPPPESVVPGGSEQTREYYNDSSSRRRKSLDRSSSTRKISASIMSEIDELKLSASHTKVSPTQDREVKEPTSHSTSLRGDCSVENLEMGGRENIAGTVESSRKGTKKSKRWSWNIFGMLHRKNGNKYEEEEEGRGGVDRTFSGSWNVEARNGFDPKMMRSNSSVSWRSSATGGGGGFQRNSVDGYVSGKKKVSSSSSSVGRKVENGVLKFNLTPSKGRRTGSMDSTSRPVPAAHPLARNVMNFY